MMPEQLEALRKTMAQKKRKAKTSSSTSKKVKFIKLEMLEVMSKPAPTVVEVTSETTTVLPPSMPLSQLLPSNAPTKAISGGLSNPELPLGGISKSAFPHD